MNAALIVVDVQRGFDDGSRGERNNPGAEVKVVRLLEAWRRSGRPVHHVYHDTTAAKGSFRPGTEGNKPKPEAAPLAGEATHRKTVNSAFIGTDLERQLRKAGIETLVIVGLTTNHCISTTARMAGNLGFETYVVSDATAAFERATIDGRIRAAQDVHDAALSDLQEEFAVVVSAEWILNAAAADAATAARTAR